MVDSTRDAPRNHRPAPPAAPPPAGETLVVSNPTHPIDAFRVCAPTAHEAVRLARAVVLGPGDVAIIARASSRSGGPYGYELASVETADLRFGGDPATGAGCLTTLDCRDLDHACELMELLADAPLADDAPSG